MTLNKALILVFPKKTNRKRSKNNIFHQNQMKVLLVLLFKNLNIAANSNTLFLFLPKSNQKSYSKMALLYKIQEVSRKFYLEFKILKFS